MFVIPSGPTCLLLGRERLRGGEFKPTTPPPVVLRSDHIEYVNMLSPVNPQTLSCTLGARPAIFFYSDHKYRMLKIQVTPGVDLGHVQFTIINH